jgi:hypothetical protein
MWVEKADTTPFETQPIEGLYFLDGDQVTDSFMPTAGKKYPMIVFPSGMACDLWQTADPKQIGIVHLFAEMNLPLGHQRNQAFVWAQLIAEEHGYAAVKMGRTDLEVWGDDPGKHYLIRYDETSGRMVDVELIEVAQPELLPFYLREQLPALYSREYQGLNAVALVKFFTSDSYYTWYAAEGSPLDEDGYFDTNKERGDFLFFGLVVGDEMEMGYFSVAELREVSRSLGLPVERDLDFTPKTLGELKELHERRESG